MFNNETGLYDLNQEDFDSQWLEDQDGLLYIVGGPGCDDIIGPNNETAGTVSFLLTLNKDDWLTEPQIRLMGLVEIPHSLKRYNCLDGFYHA